MFNILITICARAGSKSVKRKNIRLLNGKPLIYYTIKQAFDWGKASRVVVSTDSEKIAKIAREHGAEVPFIRPAELATDNTPKLPVIRHALLESEHIYNEIYDITIDLDVTAPIRTVHDLDKALKLFLEKRPKTLFSVVHAHKNPYFNMVELNKKSKVLVSKNLDKTIFRRQDAPKVYNMNASILFIKRDYLLDETQNSAISDNSIVYIMDEVASIDIDREIDFKFVEFLIKEEIISL